MGTTGGDGGGNGVDSGQLLLVGICMFGLIAAAFLAPVVGACGLVGDGPGGGGSGGGICQGDNGDGGDGGDGADESSGEPTAGDGNTRAEFRTVAPRTANDDRSRRTDGERRRGEEEDDTRWVTDEDGNRWRIEENGTRWVNEEDGRRRVIDSNGTRWVAEEDGTRQVAERNGTRWVVEENGTRWVSDRNGTRWVAERNGTRWVSDRNGTRWVAEENGTRYVVDKNGTQFVIAGNGTRRPVDANDTRWPTGANDTRWPTAANDTQRLTDTNDTQWPVDRTPPRQPPQTGCVAVVSGTPKPGTQTTVRVTVDTRPTAGVRVWFNDRFVGRTGDSGAVTGTVPFVTDLDVTVESPTDEPCRFPRRGDGPGAESAIGSGSTAAVGLAGAGAAPAVGVAGSGASVRTGQPSQSSAQGGVNNSSQYELPSNVTIRVIGEPVPGSTITLDAAVAGVPMPDAKVVVDGTQVGRTDEDGRYELTVPEAERFEVTVSRGEIRGNTTITTPQLAVRFAPQLLVPGERATVVVTREDEPIENASLTLDGERVGTTGANGTASLRLPPSVGGTVTAAVGPQTATVPLWLAYWLTASLTLVLSFLTVVTTAMAVRWRGRGTAVRLAYGWAAVWTLFVGYVVGERIGFGLAAVAIFLVALYRYRRTLASGGATSAGLVAGFVQWCSRAVLWVVGAIESLADWAQAGALRLAAWLRTLPTSVSGIAARLAAWLRTASARFWAGIRALPLRGVVAAVGAVALVAAATYAFGGPGFLVAVAVVLLAALGWWLSRREPAAPAADDSVAVSSDGSTDDGAVPTLRALWRQLASWVMPGTWQTKTPAEVSQAAIERGLPRGPVEALTEAFRDVEYGGQSEESHQSRVETAFETLERAREADEEEQG